MKAKIICFVLWAAVLWLVNYLLLIPLNVTSPAFWIMVLMFGTAALLILAIPSKVSDKVVVLNRRRGKAGLSVGIKIGGSRMAKAALLFGGIGTVLFVLAMLFCSPVFHAANYASTLGEIETNSQPYR